MIELEDEEEDYIEVQCICKHGVNYHDLSGVCMIIGCKCVLFEPEL